MTQKPVQLFPTGRAICLALFFGLVSLLLLSQAMLTPLNHDEYQFVASGQLLAARGLLPYRDYPFLHMPYMTLVNGLIAWLTGFDFLGARLVTMVCGLLRAGLIFLNVLRCGEKASNPYRTLLGCSAALLFVTNTAFQNANGRALNHAVPSLLSLLALECFSQGWIKGHPRWNLFIAGGLTGLALGTRLSYAMLLPAFCMVILLFPRRHANPAERSSIKAGAAGLLSYGSGVMAALLPVLCLAFTAPKQFFFGNFVYIHLNTGYRLAVGYEEAMTLPGKLAYFVKNVLNDPINVLLYILALGFGTFIIGKRIMVCAFRSQRQMPRPWSSIKKDEPANPVEVLVISLSLCMFLSAFAPTPTFAQYFFAPLPFLVLSGFWLVARIQRRSSALGWAFTSLILLLTFLSGARNHTFHDLTRLRQQQTWVPSQVHQFAGQIKEVLPEGKVLTLAPVFALEAGLDTYEMFTVGPLVWRSAHILSEDKRQAYGIIALTDLDRFLEGQPPDAILLGVEDRYDGFWAESPGTLEIPLQAYAEAHGYTPVEIIPGFGEGCESLWIAEK